MHRYLPPGAVILCEGARQGTEVEVLRDIGFSNAYGIDLNPGPNNPLVKKGDFMQLEETNSSLDLVYSNCVDHSFALERFFSEGARVIKPEGYALYDIASAERTHGVFEAVEWESEEEVLMVMLRYFRSVVKLETEPGWKWVLLQGKKEAPY